HSALTQTHQNARARWEAQRQELHGGWEEKHRAAARQIEERLRAEQARVAAERQRQHDQELEARAGQFGQEKAALQREADHARAEAAALRQERQAQLQQLESLRQEHDQFAAQGRELEATRAEAEQRFGPEVDRLNEALEQSRREAAETARSHD